MDFKSFNIPAAGRSNYGKGLYAISKGYAAIGEYKYKNNDNDIVINDPENNEGSFYLFLSRSQGNFEWDDIVSNNGQTDTINLIGYRGMTLSDTFVGDISVNTSDSNCGIYGLPESGMSVSVSNNGTSATTISFTVNEKISSNSGIIYIPVNLYTKDDRDESIGNDIAVWNSEKANCISMTLEYTYRVAITAVNNYSMEISNELAGINCDADGNILAGATRPTCQAEMYYGDTKVENAVYGITLPSDKNVNGVSIDTSTGILTFGSNFSFNGTSVEIKITATADGKTIFKTMTIVKQYPGADGTPATTRWVVPSVNTIKYNPNTNVLTPASVSCKAMKQVGEDAPIEDTGTTIYYGFDTTNPLTQYTGPVSPDASKDYMVFGIKNSAGVIYEIETIQIIKEGKNGTDGNNGSNGESVYKLTLTNENTSINADANGNIYSTANKPTCTATLYYGTTKVSNATYSITTNPTATGVTINSTTGVITFGSTFNFTGTSLEITVTAMVGGVVYGTAIMTVSKNMAGKDGVDGTDGINGEDGVSIVWKGSSISHPANPQNGWAYYNTAQKKSFIYQDGSWYQMTVDGTDGQDGQDGQDGSNGLSIVWKGDLASAPSNPQLNWCYRDTDNGKVYIYNGLAWELMVLDGSDGTDGADGDDGLSVFITYHDNPITSTPATPTGDGTTNGWHTTATKAANWMSQKVAATATSGTWGAPIQICGADGQDGTDGSDGADAVSYWLDLSTTEVVVTKGATVATPSSVTLKAYKQIGGNSPTDITSTGVIKWGYNTAAPQNTTTTISSINTAYTYIMVHLIVDSVIYDRQTISILKDGKDGADGTDGAQGRQGPALRGPVDWKNQTTSRRWCNGTLTNASYPEDAEFIDIVVYDGVYYMCKTSYNGKGSETTAPSSTYWTATDKQYEFVATNLLLAESAKINFTSSNELYLMDSDGNVTAGAAGGDSVNFWAGANEPENGTFKVYNNGTMEATKGKFGVLEIGKDEWDDGALYGTHTQLDGTLNNISIQPQYFEMEAVDQDDGTIKESVRIAPYADPDKYDMDGVITVFTDSETHNGIFTSGMMEAEGYTKRINSHKAFSPFSPVNNLEITFVTDTNYFTKSNGYWLWKGMYIDRTLTSTYPYVVKGSNGEWCYATSSTATSGIGTGIYTSSHIKQNNRLYIVI